MSAHSALSLGVILGTFEKHGPFISANSTRGFLSLCVPGGLSIDRSIGPADADARTWTTTTMKDEETSPLISPAGKTPTRWSTRTVVAGVSAIALMTLGCYVGFAGNGGGGLGTIWNFAFTRTTSPFVTFTLDASWIDKTIRAANPTFFASPLSKAYILRHNYGSTSFFEDEDALEMTRVGLRRWTLATNEVNYEYGFMLENENGAKLREIGAWYTNERESVTAPSANMKNCTVTFGQYRNRLISQTDTTPAFDANACFGACGEECELPDAPTPMASLSGSQYTGGTTWGNDLITCNLGTATTYDAAKQSFYIDGSQESLIVCPYDIGPGHHPELTIEIVFELDQSFDPAHSYGWIFGHDNGGFDRSFIVSDPRFGGGIASGIGSAYNSGAPTPSKGEWHHGLAVFRQGVAAGSYTALDGAISPNKATANNNEGKTSFSIGGLPGVVYHEHSMIGWIRYFNFYVGALSEDQVEAMYVRNTPWP